MAHELVGSKPQFSLGLYSKAIIAALLAGLSAAYEIQGPVITEHDWIEIAMVAITALSVYIVPNAPRSVK